MIIKNKTSLKIEKYKAKMGLKGDVYIVNNRIESLESHKNLFPQSKATTIRQAEVERIEYEKQAELEAELNRIMQVKNQSTNGEQNSIS